MRKTSLVLVLGAVVMLSFVSVAALADEKAAPPTQQDMEKMAGKELYKLNCKICHAADADAGEYTPMTYIQDQWDAFFDETYVETHKDVVDTTYGDKPVTEWITPKMLEKIRKFAVDGAADSEHPMTCG